MKKHLESYQGLSRLPVANHLHKAAQEATRFNSLPSYEPKAIWQWIVSYLRFAFGCRHDFLPAGAAPNKTSHYKVDNRMRISLTGDWGTGTSEADLVGRQMLQWPDGEHPDYTIHLGDVYYVGDAREVAENCLGKDNGTVTGVTWPIGKLGSFALNGNHEMYALGTAYFRNFLPVLGMKNGSVHPAGQGPSFFCLENDYWRIVGLDTGYNSVGLPIISLWLEGNCKLEDPLIQWLREIVKPKDKPKATILLSHHQYFSAFEDKQYAEPARQLADLFDWPLLWLWGHEHRLAGYQLFGTDKPKVFGRCIGHGGMPIDAKDPQHGYSAPREEVLFYDARPNPNYQQDGLGYNGFAQLDFDGPRLKITYLSLAAKDGKEGGYKETAEPIFSETFEWIGGQVRLTQFQQLRDEPGLVSTTPRA